MQRQLSFVLLLLLMTVQLHGLGHAFSGHEPSNHQCSICENLSHQVASVPIVEEFKIPGVVDHQLALPERALIELEKYDSSHSSRGPPQHA